MSGSVESSCSDAGGCCGILVATKVGEHDSTCTRPICSVFLPILVKHLPIASHGSPRSSSVVRLVPASTEFPCRSAYIHISKPSSMLSKHVTHLSFRNFDPSDFQKSMLSRSCGRDGGSNIGQIYLRLDHLADKCRRARLLPPTTHFVSSKLWTEGMNLDKNPYPSAINVEVSSKCTS